MAYCPSLAFHPGQEVTSTNALVSSDIQDWHSLASWFMFRDGYCISHNIFSSTVSNRSLGTLPPYIYSERTLVSRNVLIQQRTTPDLVSHRILSFLHLIILQRQKLFRRRRPQDVVDHRHRHGLPAGADDRLYPL